MNTAPGRRLPRAERRDQLLDTAQEIVRSEGTDVLTLGYLAERAGVSKPITYGHFQSRAGLLIALYRRFHEEQVASLVQAIAGTPQRLDDVAHVVSTSYMACYQESGSEWHAVAAALKGDEGMEAFYRELLDEYVALFADALAPFAEEGGGALHLRCAAIVGAAEAIAREMHQGRTGEADAIACLASLITRWMATSSQA